MIARLAGTIFTVAIIVCVVVVMSYAVQVLWEWSVLAMGMDATLVVWTIGFGLLSWETAVFLVRRMRL